MNNKTTPRPTTNELPRKLPPSTCDELPLDLSSAKTEDDIAMLKCHRIMSRIYAHHAVGRAVLEDQALFSQLVPLLEKRLEFLEAANRATDDYHQTVAELEYLEKFFPADPRLGPPRGGSGPE